MADPLTNAAATPSTAGIGAFRSNILVPRFSTTKAVGFAGGSIDPVTGNFVPGSAKQVAGVNPAPPPAANDDSTGSDALSQFSSSGSSPSTGSSLGTALGVSALGALAQEGVKSGLKAIPGAFDPPAKPLAGDEAGINSDGNAGADGVGQGPNAPAVGALPPGGATGGGVLDETAAANTAMAGAVPPGGATGSGVLDETAAVNNAAMPSEDLGNWDWSSGEGVWNPGTGPGTVSSGAQSLATGGADDLIGGGIAGGVDSAGAAGVGGAIAGSGAFDAGASEFGGEEALASLAACFITEAVMSSGGVDDGSELETLRGFRDQVLNTTPQGQALIQEYEAIAPIVVEAVSQRQDGVQIFQQIKGQFIDPAVAAVNAGNYQEALQIYANMIAFVTPFAAETSDQNGMGDDSDQLDQFGDHAAMVGQSPEAGAGAVDDGSQDWDPMAQQGGGAAAPSTAPPPPGGQPMPMGGAPSTAMPGGGPMGATGGMPGVGLPPPGAQQPPPAIGNTFARRF